MPEVTKEQAKKFYETMCTIRCFEESVKKDFLNGEIPGFCTSGKRRSEPVSAVLCVILTLLRAHTAAMATALPRELTSIK